MEKPASSFEEGPHLANVCDGRSPVAIPGHGVLRTATRELDIDLENRNQLAEGEDAVIDPYVVDWDGPHDTAKPLNWSGRKKWFNITIISLVTFLTPLASTLPGPITDLILKDFDSNDTLAGSFIVSIYVLGFGVGPLVVAPMSEVFGRAPIYHACNFLFIIFTIACGLAPSLASLLFFRLLSGIAGSCALTIGGGTISDVFVQDERGAAMALWITGPIFGPSVGPIAGGYFGQFVGWQWCFWFLSIASGIMSIVALISLRETYQPVLLERKAKLLRKQTGNPNLRAKLHRTLTLKQHFTRAIIRPSRMLLLSPIVMSLSIYLAICFGFLYLLYVTFGQVFADVYGFSHSASGLVYIGNCVGQLIGVFIFGRYSDRLLRKLAGGDKELLPEYRLPLMAPGVILVPFGLFWYGWTVEKRLHWIVPIIGTTFVGMGNMFTVMPIQSYLVDAYTNYSASAIAASSVLRSIVGCFLPLAGPQMYAKLGYGWGNTLLALLALALSPMGWVFFKYGERLRKDSTFKPE